MNQNRKRYNYLNLWTFFLILFMVSGFVQTPAIAQDNVDGDGGFVPSGSIEFMGSSVSTKDYRMTPADNGLPKTEGATYMQDTDNENNSLTGTADGDMDNYLYRANSPIEFNIFMTGALPTENAVLTIYAYDVDEEAGEINQVYFNGHFLGNMTGANDVWNTTVFVLDKSWVKSGKNLVQYNVDVNNAGWATAVDWGQLVIDGGSRGQADVAQIDYVDETIGSSTVDVNVNVPVEIIVPGNFKIELNFKDPSGNVITSTARNFTGSSVGQIVNQAYALSYPKNSSSGTYTVEAIVFETEGNTLQVFKTLGFEHTSGSGPVSAPEITVKGQGVEIADGSSSISTGNNTDFGTVDTGSNNALVFAIENEGSADLDLTGSPLVTIGGANASDFTVTSAPTTPIASGGGKVYFEITFAPTASGSRTATVSIANNDDDENPYNFTIGGAGNQTTMPEIDIRGNGVSITSGDTSPDAGDNTLFGSTDIQGGTISKTFVVHNTGDASLTVNSVSLSGVNAGDFSITTDPSGSIETGSSANLEVKFDPSTVGNKTAQITVNNNDGDENSYIFTIQGNGVTNPEIAVTGNSNAIADGSNTPASENNTLFGTLDIQGGNESKTYVINNSGSGTLTISSVTLGGTNAGDFSITTNPTGTVTSGGNANLVIKFDPSAAGTRNATVSIASDDADENPYTFAIRGTGEVNPEIAVTGNSNAIADGSNTPASENNTLFGSLDIQGGNESKTYVINNSGSGTLTISSVTLGGTNAGDFSITTNPTGTVTSGGNANLVIKFDPSAAGTRNATVSIASDDADENPYTFAIRGTGEVNPEIAVTGNSNAIADGSNTPASENNTLFGSLDIQGGNESKTYVINNSGSGTLTISSVTLGGTNAGDFSITTNPTGTVTSGGNANLVIKFDPSAAGTRNATVSIASDDADENPYTFAIRGTGEVNPEIAVTGNSNAIADGSNTPASENNTLFGSLDIQGGNESKTYVINNSGSGTLTISSVTLGGTNAGDFSITTNPTGTVTSGGNANLVIKFDPSAAGTRNATVSIASDDADENPYTFAIRGTGETNPEIDMTGDGNPIVSGDTTPSSVDGTLFPTIDVDDSTSTSTFVINNPGSGVLNITNIQITGDNAGDFSVTVDPTGTVAAGSTADLGLTFDPSAAGERNATVTITTDDANEGTYTFAIRGNGYVTSLDFTMTTNYQDSPSAPGESLALGASVNWTYILTNTGSVTLTNIAVTDDTNGVVGTIASLAAGATDSLTASGNAISGLYAGGASFTTIYNGKEVTGSDASYYTGIVSTISGLVWHDKNRDGIQDAGETGIENVSVNIYDDGSSLVTSDTTDADGNFTLTELEPGDYTVEFSDLTAHFVFSPKDQGGDDSADSDVNIATGITDVVTLAMGEVQTTTDAGIYYPATKVAGFVWNDLNRDGKQQHEEPGVKDIVVTLYDSLNVVVGTYILSDADGKYEFNTLDFGTYSVGFADIPANFAFTTKDLGEDDLIDSDADHFTGITDPFFMLPGDSSMHVDAGLIEMTGVVSGTVFMDKNGNGEQDEEESALAGSKVLLLGASSDSTLSNEQGGYKFAGVPAGSYKVTVKNDSLATFYTTTTGGDTLAVVVEEGGSVSNLNFGYEKISGSIQVVLFNDDNRDGLLSDGEVLLPDVQVVLGDVTGAELNSLSTDADGSVVFPDLDSGVYLVSVNTKDSDLPEAYWPTVADNPFYVTLTLDDPQVNTQVGLNTMSSDGGIIGDFVWHDSNWNRVPEGDEEKLPYVMIYLYRLINPSNARVGLDGNIIQEKVLVDSVRTNYFGNYYFTDVESGEYFVKAHELQYSQDKEWMITSRDSMYVEIGGTDVKLDADFGFAEESEAETGTIKGFVFNDLDSDREYTDGEPGLAGISVELYKKKTLVESAVTDGDGNVTFNDVFPGDYKLSVDGESLPLNYAVTTNNDPEALFLAGSSEYVGQGFGVAEEADWGKTPNRIIAAYQSGYDADGRYWSQDNLGGTADTSLVGQYSSDDVDVMDYHILQAWASGIDGFAVNWYGWYSWENQGVKSLLDRAELLNEHYGDKGFHFEIAAAMNENANGTLDSNLTYIADSLLAHKAYWGTERQVKRPVFINNQEEALLLPQTIKACADTTMPMDIMLVFNGAYDDSVEYMDVMYPSLQTDRYPWMTGAQFDEAFLDTVYTRLGQMEQADRSAFTVGGVWPGYDDRNWVEGQNQYVDAADTTVFGASWRKILEYEEQYSIPWTMVQSWNDYNRGTAIEPGFGYNYNYNVLTRDYARLYKDPLVPVDSVGVADMGMLVPRYIYMARLAAKVHPENASAIEAQVDQAYSQFFDRDYETAITTANKAAGLVPPAIIDAVVENTSITVSWEAVATANTYYVHVSKDSASYIPCAFETADMINAGNVTSFTLSELESNTKYYIAVTSGDSTLGRFMDSWYQHAGGNASITSATTGEEVVTGIADGENALPKSFALDQNYPNPFNPRTTIQYALPKKQHVSIKLYNTLGQQVMTLVDNEHSAGYYNVQLDGSSLGSGIYFYRIISDDFTATRKLLLVK